MIHQFMLWIRALRAPFFQVVILPVALGTAIASINFFTIGVHLLVGVLMTVSYIIAGV